jgi:hypothetical protein
MMVMPFDEILTDRTMHTVHAGLLPHCCISSILHPPSSILRLLTAWLANLHLQPGSSLPPERSQNVKKCKAAHDLLHAFKKIVTHVFGKVKKWSQL